MRENRTVPSVSVLFAAALLCAFVANLLLATTQTPWHVSEVSMLIFAAAAYTINNLILKKERPNWHIALTNAAIFTAGFVGLAVLNGVSPANAGFLFGYIVIFVSFLAWWLNANPITQYASAIIFECSIVFIVLYVWIGSLTVIVPSDLLWIVCMSVFCLVGMISFRVTGAVHSRTVFTVSRTVIFAVSALLIAVTVLLMTAAAEPLGDLLLGVFSLGGRILSFIIHLVTLFFAWLDKIFMGSLNPGEEGFKAPNYDFSSQEIPEGNPIAVLFFIAGLAIFFAVVAIVYLVKLLKQRHKPEKAAVSKAAKRTRPSVTAALRKIIARLRERIRLWWVMTVHRDTPVGLYVRLTRACRLSRYHRHRADTPRIFLLRLADMCREMGDTPTAEELISLANEVDKLSYSQKTGFGKRMKNASRLYSHTVSLMRRSQLTLRKAASDT